MRGYRISRVALVDGVLDEEALVPRDGIAAHTAEQLSGLAREHGAKDELDAAGLHCRHFCRDSKQENEKTHERKRLW